VDKMVAYYFVAAAVLAALPILTLYKVLVGKLKEEPSAQASIQQKFFIGVALSETIPLLLIVFGYINLTPVNSVEELYIPGLIVLFIMAYAVFFIFLQRNVDVTPEAKPIVQSFTLISLALALGVPIIALVSLFMMMP
jgi:F0F1-type ATP synthase membrane subunit c/vacuolar-type H+-ATPase subunit K